MLTALTIISLLSLLVATEAEPTGSPVQRVPEPPLRPKPGRGDTKGGNPDRLAA